MKCLPRCGLSFLVANELMRPGGFEPPTNSLEGCCSIHLSYGRVLSRKNLIPSGWWSMPWCDRWCRNAKPRAGIHDGTTRQGRIR